MSELAGFLLARIAEDETMAQHSLDGDLDHLPSVDANGQRLFLGVTNPARVLAECEAKRRIIETCQVYEYEVTNAYGYDDILQALALPYADHPECRDEWRPDR